jgi:hypothetical protein
LLKLFFEGGFRVIDLLSTETDSHFDVCGPFLGLEAIFNVLLIINNEEFVTHSIVMFNKVKKVLEHGLGHFF